MHFFAQQFTVCTLHAMPPPQLTAHTSPLQPVSGHAIFPVHAISVCVALLRTLPQEDVPLHSTLQVDAVPQSALLQLPAPVHVIRHGIPGGQVTPVAHEGRPGQASTQVPPSQVPPEAGHAA